MLSAKLLSVFLTFDNATRRQSFPVTIKDDDISELTENFVIELRFDPYIDQPLGIELWPNVSTITISDTDRTLPCGLYKNIAMHFSSTE